ncbi:thioredoxin family protein [Arenibacter sp. 6A1]|uniref:thioredoxin family protein n=1 Tax=Arenibacter sp. 6A1 TaxID=2720391 RepID=UPI001445D39B|nr:thioredoxin family protein [Arenibacter sp. 6A1]NKI25087.1 thioredoxin family protein [Arenibacter sp. 6A1]
MKRILFLLFFPMLLSGQVASKATDTYWVTNYKDALSLAKENNKNILIYFTGSDWCPPCRALKNDLFDTAKFKDLANNYVLLYVDIPRNKKLISVEEMNHNKELLAKWNKKGVFPAISVVSPLQKEVAYMSGYGSKNDLPKYADFLQTHR